MIENFKTRNVTLIPTTFKSTDSSDSGACSDWWILIREVWWSYSRNKMLLQSQKSCHFVFGRYLEEFGNSMTVMPIFFTLNIWGKLSIVDFDFANVNLKVILWFERSYDSGKWAIGSSENSRLLKFRLHWDLALADRSFKIQNGRHKTQNTRER